MFLKVGYRPDLVDAKPNGGTGGGTAPGALLLLLLLLAPLRRGGGACGNWFLLYNNVFLYYKTEPFFPIIYYPYFPVKFLILGLLNSWIGKINEVD